MKQTYRRLSIIIFACLFLFSFSGNTYSQDTAESLRRSISEADKESIRLLQEELEIKQRKNAEQAEKNRKLKQESEESEDSLPSDDVQTGNSNRSVNSQKTENASSVAPVTKSTTTPANPLTNTGAANVPSKSDEKADESGTTTVTDAKCSVALQNLEQYSVFRQQLCRLVEESKPNTEERETIVKVNFSDSADVLVRLITAKTITDADSPKLLNAKNFLLKTEKVRTDKQIGSDSKSNGTTSIVSKGGIPAFFAFATENGGAVSSIDGTTMTYRINPAGLLQAATGSNYLELFEERREKPFLDFLGKTSLGFSFDTTRGFETPTFTGKENQLSAFSFRYEFINERSPKHSKFRKLWQGFVKGQGQQYFEKQNAIFDQILTRTERGRKKINIPELQEWLDNLNAKLSAESSTIVGLMNGNDDEATDKIEEIINAELDKLPVSKIRANSLYSNFVASVELDEAYIDARNDVLDAIGEGQVATFEYINFREPIKPDTHSLRFIWEKGIWRGTDFTINASLTFYNKKPTTPDVGRIRDFDISGQFDIPLRRTDTGVFKDSVISFAGKYQRLNTDIVNEIGLITPGTKGDIAVGQLKWTIPIGDTGIKIPLSFTVANRTELIKEKEVRGNFGITIDFDSILARLKTFPALLNR